MSSAVTRESGYRTFTLDPVATSVSEPGSTAAWSVTVDQCVQQALGAIFDVKVQGRALESTEFFRALSDRCASVSATPGARYRATPMQLFRDCAVAFEFRLEDREYGSVAKASFARGEETRTRDESLSAEHRRLLANLWGDREIQRDRQASEQSQLGAELLAILLGHLVDCASESTATNQANFALLNSRRRALVANWALRLEDQVRRTHEHSADAPILVAYPFVDLMPVGESHVVALVVAPKDALAIDEIVAEDHRLAPISLVVFECSGIARKSLALEALPLLREGLARVLFSSLAHRNSRTVEASFGELSTINRIWFRTAADGAAGVLKGEAQKRFNGLRFGEAIVRELLCSLPGVERTEVYPFDRALIFGESFFDDRILRDEPIPMLVLEASVVSDNPSDKGQSMTRRERLLSDTDDSECNMAAKSIQDQDAIQLYIHSGSNDKERQFVLSAKQTLTTREKELAYRARAKSRDAREANLRAYGIPTFETRGTSAIGEAIENILLRVDKTAQTVTSSRVDDVVSEESERFKEDAKKLRPRVAARADKDGLYFAYAHGLTLKDSVPDLRGILDAYSAYLADRFYKEDDSFREERFRSENLKPADIAKLVDAERRKQKKDDSSNDGRSKVVLIQFSYDLHDGNMARLREDRRKDREERQGDRDAAPVLGEEYAFTIILVADNEQPKSIPQLERERKDLQTMLQILVAQLWADKLNEHEYLTRRTGTMIGSMKQALHALKNSVGPEKVQQVNGLLAGFERLAGLTKPTPEPLEFDSIETFLQKALDYSGEPQLRAVAERFGLGERAARVVGTLEHIKLPHLRASWVLPAVRDAVSNVLKNAFDRAAPPRDGGRGKPIVNCRVEFVPVPTIADVRAGFLDVVVENSGAPIPAERLKRLREVEPRPLGEDRATESSSGFGIYLARTSLQSSIGEGADILYENVGDRTVQARVRLPASIDPLFALSENDPAPDPTLSTSPLPPYVLFVEDDSSIVNRLGPLVEDAAREAGLAFRHAGSYRDVMTCLEGGVPLLVISDFNLPESRTSEEGPAQKWGCEVVRSIIEASPVRPTDTRDVPPIWIWTAEGPDTVRDSLIELGSIFEACRFAQPSPSDPSLLFTRGSVCVMENMKNLGVFEQHWSRTALRNAALGDRRNPEAMQKRNEVRGARGRLVSLTISPDSFANQIDDALALLRRAEERLTILGLHIDVRAPRDVDRVFALWARTIRAEPDRVREDDSAFALHRRGRHKRVVLLLPPDCEGATQLPIDVRYALLARNVWVLQQRIDDDELAEIWRTFRAEDSGALSTLRHDLPNDGSDDVETLRDLINRSESLLRSKETFDRVAGLLAESATPWSSLIAASTQRMSATAEHPIGRANPADLLHDLERRFAAVDKSGRDRSWGKKAADFELRVARLRMMLGADR